MAPPDGSAVLTLIQAKPESPQARLVGRATQVVFVTEDLPATYTDGDVGAFASEPHHAFDGSSTNGRALTLMIVGALDNRAGPFCVGRRIHALPRPRWEHFDLVGFDEVSRAVGAKSPGRPRETGRGTARGA